MAMRSSSQEGDDLLSMDAVASAATPTEGSGGQALYNDTDQLLGSIEAPMDAPGVGGNAPQGQMDAPPTGICACFSVAYYRPYFDVDTDQVKDRLLRAAMPTKNDPPFLEIIRAKPDAYGPFWIATSLLFTIAVGANVSSWLKSDGDPDSVWTYDFNVVLNAAIIIYGFLAAMPTVYWLVMRHFAVPFQLVHLFCLYGYSLFSFVFAVLLCLIPSETLHWCALLGAAATSVAFLVKNTAPVVLESVPAQAVPILAVAGCANVIFALTLKIVFFA